MNERRAYFESFADEWDKMFTAQDLEVLEFLVDSFAIKKGHRVVDLGCGTGVLFDLLRRKVGEKGMVVGVDFSTRMLHKAKMNFPFPNIIAIDGDVEDMPLRSDFFDIAISFAAFAHFSRQETVITEAARILKPGGSFNIIHLYSSKEIVEEHHRTGGPVAEDAVPDPKKLKKLFEDHDFKDIKVTDHPGLYLAVGIKK